MTERALETEGWFYPKLTRAIAEEYLQSRGQDGSFLVRECENPKGVYVMSYRKSGFIFHSKIDHADQLYRIAGGRKFSTISKLVEFYTEHDGILTTDTGATIKLMYPLYETDRDKISWYHGVLSPGGARERLVRGDVPEGGYLVMQTDTHTDSLALCVRTGDTVTDICIQCKENNKYYLGNDVSFSSLPELVGHCHKVPPVDGGGGQVHLTKPVNKQQATNIRRHSQGQDSTSKTPSPRQDSVASSQNGLSMEGSGRPQMTHSSQDSGGSDIVGDTSQDCDKEMAGSVVSDSLDNEPLYQVYHRNVVTREIVQQVEISGEEEGQQNGDVPESRDLRLMDERVLKRHVSNILRRSRMSVSPGGHAQLGARQSCLFDVLKYGMGQLNLWRHIPEVQRSGVLNTMDAKDKRLQESLYEIITSEASYLKSVHVLIDHFHNAPVFQIDRDQSILTKHNQRFLFSNIKKVQEISKGFLLALRELKKKSYVLDPAEVATTVIEYAEKHFEVYVVYSKNQAYQTRALSELREKYPAFNQGVLRLEKDPKAQGLPFQSFLLLPVQRITRMPLLLDSVLSSMHQQQAGYDKLKECFCRLQKFVVRCNEEAKQMADIEQVAKISEMLDFRQAKKVPLVSQHRSLVREGTVTNLGPHTFDTGVRKPFQLYLFLFNDLLVITKRKGAGSFEVLDNASRNNIQVDILNEEDVEQHLPQGVSSGYSDMFLLRITDKDIKCILSCESMSHQMRWVEALTPPAVAAPTVKLFNENDYPQAQVIQPYVAQQPDELSLEESDVVNITMKLGDGWWQGHRIHDNQKGWFPSAVVVEIQSAHMRERNRRQQYRLLFGYNRLSNEFAC